MISIVKMTKNNPIIRKNDAKRITECGLNMLFDSHNI